MAKVKSADLVVFSTQFASMLSSQLPLIQVLDNLSRETPNPKLKAAVENITDDLESGVDFGDALEGHRDIFDDVYINVVKSGLMSGRLGEAVQQVAGYMEKADQIHRQVRGALSYPIFMLATFFVVFNLMVFFILPRFAAMFTNLDQLPGPTMVMMAMGDFWKAWWHLILGSLGGLWFGALVWIATPDGRYLWDKHKLGMPIVGRLWRLGALARFLRTLSVQLQNEVELLHALGLAASASNNLYVEETLGEIIDEVERGGSLTHAFERYDIFSGIVLQMISAGEEAGTLDELLMSAARYFDRLLEGQVESATRMINPILTILMGLSTAGMMVAAFLPVFEMAGQVG